MDYLYKFNLYKEMFTCEQVSELYDKRSDCENIYDELKIHWESRGFAFKIKQD